MDIAVYTDLTEYPDWRWTRIKGLLKEKKQPTARDDKYIHRGFKFAEALESCDGSDTSMFSLTMNFRDVGKAVGLHNNKSNRKYFLEAMALCRDTDEPSIAQYLGESQFMVRYYLKLFFDVRDKLDSPGFICSRIMEPAVLQSVQDCKDPNIAWKLAGLFGGYDAVKMCWEMHGGSEKARSYFRDCGMSALFKDFGVGQHLRPVNRFNADIIAEHVLRFAELEMKNREMRGVHGDMNEERVNMLKDIMGSLKFFVADPSAQLPAREPRLFEKIDQSLVVAVTGD